MAVTSTAMTECYTEMEKSEESIDARERWHPHWR